MDFINQEWIAVSEKMPEPMPGGEAREVLITVENKAEGYSDVYKGFYEFGTWWTQWCHGCSKVSDVFDGDDLEVTAWMPLPKPWVSPKKPKLINCEDTVRALSKAMPTMMSPDGSHPSDEAINVACEAFADAIRIVEEMPDCGGKTNG